MTYRITLKDPDGFSESFALAARETVRNLRDVTEDERMDLAESRQEAMEKQAEKWVEYSEYVTLEIDTEANTCVVIPRK